MRPREAKSEDSRAVIASFFVFQKGIIREFLSFAGEAITVKRKLFTVEEYFSNANQSTRTNHAKHLTLALRKS